jgi:chromosomal replication initiator protein
MADKIDEHLSMVSEHRKAMRDIAIFHGTTLEEIKKNPNRDFNAILARDECMYYLRHRRKWTYPMIGREFNRHHSTAMYAIKKQQQRLADLNGAKGMSLTYPDRFLG